MNWYRFVGLVITVLSLTSCIQVQLPMPSPAPTSAPPTMVPTTTPFVLVVTATPFPTTTPTVTPLPTIAPSPTPVVVVVTLTPVPSATPTPLSEAAKKCGNIPSDRACLWIHNYRGGNDTIWVTINQSQYPIPPGGDVIIYIVPGTYQFTANIPGRGLSGSGSISCPKAGEAYSYFFY
jgi:hypothetical protein